MPPEPKKVSKKKEAFKPSSVIFKGSSNLEEISNASRFLQSPFITLSNAEVERKVAIQLNNIRIQKGEGKSRREILSSKCVNISLGVNNQTTSIRMIGLKHPYGQFIGGKSAYASLTLHTDDPDVILEVLSLFESKKSYDTINSMVKQAKGLLREKKAIVPGAKRFKRAVNDIGNVFRDELLAELRVARKHIKRKQFADIIKSTVIDTGVIDNTDYDQEEPLIINHPLLNSFGLYSFVPVSVNIQNIPESSGTLSIALQVQWTDLRYKNKKALQYRIRSNPESITTSMVWYNSIYTNYRTNGDEFLSQAIRQSNNAAGTSPWSTRYGKEYENSEYKKRVDERLRRSIVTKSTIANKASIMTSSIVLLSYALFRYRNSVMSLYNAALNEDINNLTDEKISELSNALVGSKYGFTAYSQDPDKPGLGADIASGLFSLGADRLFSGIKSGIKKVPYVNVAIYGFELFADAISVLASGTNDSKQSISLTFSRKTRTGNKITEAKSISIPTTKDKDIPSNKTPEEVFKEKTRRDIILKIKSIKDAIINKTSYVLFRVNIPQLMSQYYIDWVIEILKYYDKPDKLEEQIEIWSAGASELLGDKADLQDSGTLKFLGYPDIDKFNDDLTPVWLSVHKEKNIVFLMENALESSYKDKAKIINAEEEKKIIQEIRQKVTKSVTKIFKNKIDNNGLNSASDPKHILKLLNDIVYVGMSETCFSTILTIVRQNYNSLITQVNSLKGFNKALYRAAVITHIVNNSIPEFGNMITLLDSIPDSQFELAGVTTTIIEGKSYDYPILENYKRAKQQFKDHNFPELGNINNRDTILHINKRVRSLIAYGNHYSEDLDPVFNNSAFDMMRHFIILNLHINQTLQDILWTSKLYTIKDKDDIGDIFDLDKLDDIDLNNKSQTSLKILFMSPYYAFLDTSVIRVIWERNGGSTHLITTISVTLAGMVVAFLLGGAVAVGIIIAIAVIGFVIEDLISYVISGESLLLSIYDFIRESISSDNINDNAQLFQQKFNLNSARQYMYSLPTSKVGMQLIYKLSEFASIDDDIYSLTMNIYPPPFKETETVDTIIDPDTHINIPTRYYKTKKRNLHPGFWIAVDTERNLSKRISQLKTTTFIAEASATAKIPTRTEQEAIAKSAEDSAFRQYKAVKEEQIDLFLQKVFHLAFLITISEIDTSYISIFERFQKATKEEDKEINLTTFYTYISNLTHNNFDKILYGKGGKGLIPSTPIQVSSNNKRNGKYILPASELDYRQVLKSGKVATNTKTTPPYTYLLYTFRFHIANFQKIFLDKNTSPRKLKGKPINELLKIFGNLAGLRSSIIISDYSIRTGKTTEVSNYEQFTNSLRWYFLGTNAANSYIFKNNFSFREIVERIYNNEIVKEMPDEIEEQNGSLRFIFGLQRNDIESPGNLIYKVSNLSNAPSKLRAKVSLENTKYTLDGLRFRRNLLTTNDAAYGEAGARILKNQMAEIIDESFYKSFGSNNSKMTPTFKLYFMQENASEWLLLDDHYSYSGVSSIQIREEAYKPTVTAKVTLLNFRNQLTNQLSDRVLRENPLFYDASHYGDVSSIMIKPGCKIGIYLGYGSTLQPEDYVFSGEINEIKGDQIVEIICTGYGTALLDEFGTGNMEVVQVAASDLEYQLDQHSMQSMLIRKILSSNFSQSIERLEGRLTDSGFLQGSSGIDTDTLPPEDISLLTKAKEYSIKTLVSSFTEIFTIRILKSKLGIDNKDVDFLVNNLFEQQRFNANINENIRISHVPSNDTRYTLLRENNFITGLFTNSNLKEIYLSIKLRNTGYFSQIPVLGRITSLYEETKNLISSWYASAARDTIGYSNNGGFLKYFSQNQTYWDALQEILLQTPNHVAMVRPFGDRNTIVIGDFVDGYYQTRRRNLSSEQLTRQIIKTLAPNSSNSIDIFVAILSRALEDTDESIALFCQYYSIAGKVRGNFGEISSGIRYYGVPDDGQIEYIIRSINRIVKTSLSAKYLSNAQLGKALKDVSSFQAIKDFVFGEDKTYRELNNRFNLKEDIQVDRDLDQNNENIKLFLSILKTKYNIIINDHVTGRLMLLLLLFKTKELLEIIDDINPDKKDNTRDVLSKVLISLFIRYKQTDLTNTEIDEDNVKDGLTSSAIIGSICLDIAAQKTFKWALNTAYSRSSIFRRISKIHAKASGTDIISNNIQLMKGFNVVDLSYIKPELNDKEIEDVLINNQGQLVPNSTGDDSFIDSIKFRLSEKLKWLNVYKTFIRNHNLDISNSNRNILLASLGTQVLCNLVRDYYSGDIIFLGDQDIKVWDRINIYDEVNDMVGTIQVKAVTHEFSKETGFTTTVEPMLTTYNDFAIPSTDNNLNNWQFALTTIKYLALGVGSVWMYKKFKANKGFRYLKGWFKRLDIIQGASILKNNELVRSIKRTRIGRLYETIKTGSKKAAEIYRKARRSVFGLSKVIGRTEKAVSDPKLYKAAQDRYRNIVNVIHDDILPSNKKIKELIPRIDDAIKSLEELDDLDDAAKATLKYLKELRKKYDKSLKTISSSVQNEFERESIDRIAAEIEEQHEKVIAILKSAAKSTDDNEVESAVDNISKLLLDSSNKDDNTETVTEIELLIDFLRETSESGVSRQNLEAINEIMDNIRKRIIRQAHNNLEINKGEIEEGIKSLKELIANTNNYPDGARIDDLLKDQITDVFNEIQKISEKEIGDQLTSKLAKGLKELDYSIDTTTITDAQFRDLTTGLYRKTLFRDKIIIDYILESHNQIGFNLAASIRDNIYNLGLAILGRKASSLRIAGEFGLSALGLGGGTGISGLVASYIAWDWYNDLVLGADKTLNAVLAQTYGQNAVSISGLYVKGEPFLANVDGMDKASIFSASDNPLDLFEGRFSRGMGAIFEDIRNDINQYQLGVQDQVIEFHQDETPSYRNIKRIE